MVIEIQQSDGSILAIQIESILAIVVDRITNQGHILLMGQHTVTTEVETAIAVIEKWKEFNYGK